MPGLDDLVMRSNVARDVLNTARQFGSVQKMLPEYVTNATDNPNDDQQAVRVEIIKRSQPHGRHRIIVRDNARGMDAEGLRLFFTMHAENRARRRGQRARGRFGTGKAAAFGVGASALQQEMMVEAKDAAPAPEFQKDAPEGNEAAPVA